jgi:ribosome-binding factor A
MRRVNESLREVIAGEVVRLKDPGIGFVTITGVVASPDLRAARVYYSVLGDDVEKESTQAALDRAAPRVQAVVGSEIRMKYNPRLEFVFDQTVERGLRMERLLHEIAEVDDDA